MKLRMHKFDLELKHAFTIARSSLKMQQTLIVELSDGTHHGYGEATTNTYYGMTYEKMIRSLEAVRDELEAISQVAPETLWSQVAARFADCPFALNALDQAAHDLWGKQQGAPVYKLWGLDPANSPLSNFTIGIDQIDIMVAKLQEEPGWPIYKIKLGTKHDLDIVRQLRKETDAVFRIDANCGWTVEETIEHSCGLKELGVEFIEQPLPASDWDGYRQVYGKSALPIVADESCISEGDVARCQGCFHAINIKLVKCGGLTPARRMIREARALGMQVMGGCMTESTVGISALAQLLPLLDYVDMDGAALLAKDIATGVSLQQGRCCYANENGTGVCLIGSV